MLVIDVHHESFHEILTTRDSMRQVSRFLSFNMRKILKSSISSNNCNIRIFFQIHIVRIIIFMLKHFHFEHDKYLKDLMSRDVITHNIKSAKVVY
jgi:hypothetical protein